MAKVVQLVRAFQVSLPLACCCLACLLRAAALPGGAKQDRLLRFSLLDLIVCPPGCNSACHPVDVLCSLPDLIVCPPSCTSACRPVVLCVFNKVRGHLLADIDPLGLMRPRLEHEVGVLPALCSGSVLLLLRSVLRRSAWAGLCCLAALLPSCLYAAIALRQGAASLVRCIAALRVS